MTLSVYIASMIGLGIMLRWVTQGVSAIWAQFDAVIRAI